MPFSIELEQCNVSASSGPCPGHFVSENQAQEFLLLWSVASRDEKGSDLNVRDLST
jgi:hypothetical protein